MILKSNNKYLVIRVKDKVIKYDLKTNSKLKNEYDRIKYLINYDDFYQTHHIPVYNYKKKNIYHFKDKYSYEMPYFKGNSFSKILRNKNINHKDKWNYINILYSNFKRICLRKSEIDSNVKLVLWENKLKDVLKDLLNINYLKGLIDSPIKINNVIIENPKILLLEFFNTGSNSFRVTDKIHGNFHSENIIIPSNYDFNNFKLIDPDCNIKNMDPLFSLARFFYTYIHDTIENNKFDIISSINNSEIKSFVLQYLWVSPINESYSLIDKKIMEHKNNFKTNSISNRLLKCFIICLLIGVKANENGMEIKNLKSNNLSIKSNSLFLLLSAFYHICTIINYKKI